MKLLQPTPFSCERARNAFSGYLDGAISGHEMRSVRTHLDACPGCAAEFATWRVAQRALTAAGPARPPADLGLKLRLAISHEAARRRGRRWDSFTMRWENLLRPALLQAAAGLASAVLLLGGIGMLIGAVAAPQPVQANDEPLTVLTSPRYLYSAARQQPVATAADTTIVVQARINSAGRVYDFDILTGPQDALTRQQVRDQLMLQVYEPARIFGEAVRGRVLVTFAGVSVHG